MIYVYMSRAIVDHGSERNTIDPFKSEFAKGSIFLAEDNHDDIFQDICVWIVQPLQPPPSPLPAWAVHPGLSTDPGPPPGPPKLDLIIMT